MRTFSLWSVVFLSVLAGACGGGPTSPSAALSTGASETLPTAIRSLDEIAAVRPAASATNLNLKGIVSAVDADALTITVSSAVISVPATATIVDAMDGSLTFGDISVGKRVHVSGKTVDAVSTASVVRVLDWAVAGTVTALDGTCPALTFTVDGQDVATTATTEFSRGDCTKVADGLQVEVQGTIDAGVLTAVRVVLPQNITPKPPKAVGVQGSISLASGSCPAMIFTVAGQEVRTDASTIFTGPGKCPSVANGKIADITGLQETDHIRAVRVKVRK